MFIKFYQTMSKLSETWFIEGNIDFESKKYTLLAYLRRIDQAFHNNQLYPQLSDLIFHYNNLQKFRKNKALLQSQFPKKLSNIQLEKLRLIYEEMIEDSELITQIEDIVHYAMQTMKGTVSAGADFYDFVENSLAISPIGILPPNIEEGFFFLCDGRSNTIRVYDYQLSIISRPEDRYRALKSKFVKEWTRNFVNTYESIKLELLKKRKSFNLPAVYCIETDLKYPIEATLLPVAKRSLVRYLATG